MSAQAAILLCALLALLAGCQSEPEAPQSGAVGADISDRARAACEAQGGSFGRAPGARAEGTELRICYIEPSDANRPCRSANECEGMCLARSRTCAPVIPLLGCNEILQANGLEATICID